MGHVEDRWTRPGPSGRRVKSDRYGRGKRWQAVWVEAAGTRRRASFDTKDAALGKLARVSVQRSDGSYVRPNRVTVGELWPRWEQARSQLAKSTRVGYDAAWRTYIQPRWEHIPVQDVDLAAVKEWLPTLRTRAMPNTPARQLSASWARKVGIVLHGLLEMAVESKLLAVSPLTKLAKAMPKQLASERRYLSVAEVDLLIANAGPIELPVRVLVFTGIRRGEMAGLRVGDLDAARSRLRVARDVDEDGEFDATKTRKHRDVPIGGDVRTALIAAARGRDRTALLLPGPDGTPWRRNSWRSRWNTACASAGLADLVAHELRHTAVSLAIHAGANIKTIQRMVGHTSAAITLDTYGHLWEDELDGLPAAVERHMDLERSRANK